MRRGFERALGFEHVSWVRGAASPGHQLEARPRRSGRQAWIDRPRCHVLAQAGLRVPSSGCRWCSGPPSRFATGVPDSVPVHRRTRPERACRPLREHLGLAGSREHRQMKSSRVRGDHGRLPHTFHRCRLRLGPRVDECRPGRFEVGQRVRRQARSSGAGRRDPDRRAGRARTTRGRDVAARGRGMESGGRVRPNNRIGRLQPT